MITCGSSSGGYGGGYRGGYGGYGRSGGYGGYGRVGQGGDCGCDDGCGAGGAGGGCCGDGYDEAGLLSYVSPGGSYRQETTFRYVGMGAGDHEVVPVPTNFRSNICCCIIPLLLLLLLPLLYYLLSALSYEPATLPPVPAPTPVPLTTSEPYDCKAAGLWSFSQKGWCCQHYGV